MKFDDATRKSVDDLKEKLGGKLICPICQHNEFGVIPRKFRHTVQNRSDVIELGGPGIDTMMLVCQYCNYILEFNISELRCEDD